MNISKSGLDHRGFFGSQRGLRLRDHVGMVGEVLLNKVSPVALGQFAGEAVEVKAVYRIDHHPAKDHSSLEKHTGDIRVRNLIKLLRLPA